MEEMHDRFLVVDAHSDLLLDVVSKRETGRKNVIDEDWLPGMRRGGIGIRVAALCSSSWPDLALPKALNLVAALYEEIDESSNLMLCTSADDIRQAKESGKIGFILGMEGAEPLGRDIHLLRIFYTLGLRLLGITHFLRNYAGDGASRTSAKTSNVGGLSEFGMRLLQEANELGVVIDVSHLNIPGFWDVMQNTKAPVVASHSDCRALLDHPRNLWDEQIKAIGENGGVIGINAVGHFVGDKKDRTLGRLMDHLDHIVKVGGVNSAGLGFDFADYLMKYYTVFATNYLSKHPDDRTTRRAGFVDLTTVQGLARGDEDVPKVAEELVSRGYKEREIELLLGKNFLRVFEEVLKSGTGYLTTT